MVNSSRESNLSSAVPLLRRAVYNNNMTATQHHILTANLALHVGTALAGIATWTYALSSFLGA